MFCATPPHRAQSREETSRFSAGTASPPLFPEPLDRRRYYTHAEARADIFDYIERFYNPRMQLKLQMVENKEFNLNSSVRGRGT
jgi:transposase InsO family protein